MRHHPKLTRCFAKQQQQQQHNNNNNNNNNNIPWLRTNSVLGCSVLFATALAR